MKRETLNRIPFVMILMLLIFGISSALAADGSFSGTYSIIASHSGKAVDVWEWGTTDGTNIAQYNYWEGDAQKFNITAADGIWHRISPVISTSQAVEVAEGRVDDGANIQTYSYWGHACQQWRFQEAGGGTYYLVNRNSGLCMGVAGASQDDGANVVQQTCTGAASQTFELVETGATSGGATGGSGADIVRDEQPGLKTGNGPYRTAEYSLPRSATPADTTVFYPTNAAAPFSGIVFCPPFTIQRSGFRAWGPWFASHGIVLVTMDTRTAMDYPDDRANQQAQNLRALAAENTRSGSPLYGKLDTSKIGAMGWSMGGGATWINSSQKNFPVATAMSLAGHNMTATDVASRGGQTRCPILIMNGATDTSILGGMGQSIGVYRAVPAGIPKAIYEVATAGHMVWGTPTQASPHVAELALAFQKTFLDGDLRWAQYIRRPSNNVATWNSANIN